MHRVSANNITYIIDDDDDDDDDDNDDDDDDDDDSGNNDEYVSIRVIVQLLSLSSPSYHKLHPYLIIQLDH